jgi:hypothetical protein
MDDLRIRESPQGELLLSGVGDPDAERQSDQRRLVPQRRRRLPRIGGVLGAAANG